MCNDRFVSETIKTLAKKKRWRNDQSLIRDAGETAVRFKRQVFLAGKLHRISVVYKKWGGKKYHLKVNPKYVLCFVFIVWRLLTNCWTIDGG